MTDVNSASGMIITQTGELVASGSKAIERDVDMESNCTTTGQSPFPSKPNKRKRQPKDDAIIAIMREKTDVLRELASTSNALNVAYNRESSTKVLRSSISTCFQQKLHCFQPICNRSASEKCNKLSRP